MYSSVHGKTRFAGPYRILYFCSRRLWMLINFTLGTLWNKMAVPIHLSSYFMEETLKVAELIATQYATVTQTQSFYGFDHLPSFQQFHLQSWVMTWFLDNLLYNLISVNPTVDSSFSAFPMHGWILAFFKYVLCITFSIQ